MAARSFKITCKACICGLHSIFIRPSWYIRTVTFRKVRISRSLHLRQPKAASLVQKRTPGYYSLMGTLTWLFCGPWPPLSKAVYFGREDIHSWELGNREDLTFRNRCAHRLGEGGWRTSGCYNNDILLKNSKLIITLQSSQVGTSFLGGSFKKKKKKEKEKIPSQQLANFVLLIQFNSIGG